MVTDDNPTLTLTLTLVPVPQLGHAQRLELSVKRLDDREKKCGVGQTKLRREWCENDRRRRRVGEVSRGLSAWPHLSTGAASSWVVGGVQLQQRVELQGEAVAHGRWQAERRQLGSEAAHGSPPCRAALPRATSGPLEPQTARAVVADERSKFSDLTPPPKALYTLDENTRTQMQIARPDTVRQWSLLELLVPGISLGPSCHWMKPLVSMPRL